MITALFLTGLALVAISYKKLIFNINKPNLYHASSSLDTKTSNINIIAGGLILTIPLQAWIDVKFIHADKSWGIRIGFVILGMALALAKQNG